MKILYIANARIPTEKVHGYQIAKMCESLALAGHELELVLPTRANPEFAGVSLFNHYQVKDNFAVKKIECFDPVFLFKFPKGLYIKFQGFLFLWSLFFYLLELKHRKEYTIYTRDEYLLPLLVKFSKQVVWEAHFLPQNKQRYLKCFNQCHKIVVITSHIKQELVDLGINSEKIVVASDAVDLTDFQNISANRDELRNELNLPKDKKIVLYTGHLYSWKGADSLAQAVNDLDNDTLAVFVGGTDSDLKSFRDEYGTNSKIMILGLQPRKFIPQYLKSADVLVLPNSAKSKISKYYTSPMKLFEYMAAGRPIVATNLPSITEILNDNNAVLVTPDNPSSLADGIIRVLKDKELAEKISSHTLMDVKNYTWENRAKKITEFICS